MEKQPTTKSIYDFIYLDIDRIHSYYAQLTDGVPSQKKTSNNQSKSYKHELSGLPRDVFHVKGSHEDTNGSLFEQSMDMHHVLPRDMINLLDEYNLISKKLASSNLGKLVMVKGLISFSDFEILSKNSNTAIEVAKEKGSANDVSEKTMTQVMGVIGAYPIGVQATMQIESATTHYAWMALDKQYLTSAHLVSALKHEKFSSEEFYVLGILDGVPNKFEIDNNEDMKKFQDTLSKSNPFYDALFAMTSTYKDLIGRPKGFYGITPISIFRVLKATINPN